MFVKGILPSLTALLFAPEIQFFILHYALVDIWRVTSWVLLLLFMADWDGLDILSLIVRMIGCCLTGILRRWSEMCGQGQEDIIIIIIHSWWHAICQWKHIKIWINWIAGAEQDMEQVFEGWHEIAWSAAWMGNFQRYVDGGTWYGANVYLKLSMEERDVFKINGDDKIRAVDMIASDFVWL